MTLLRRLTIKWPPQPWLNAGAMRTARAGWRARAMATALLAGAMYFAGVKLGLLSTPSPRPIAVFWPPSAVLLAALLSTPVPRWKYLFFPLLAAHLLAQPDSAAKPLLATYGFLSQLVGALVGAGALRLALGRAPRFERVREVGLFLLYGVVLAPMLTALADAAALWAPDRHLEFGALWRTYFLAGALAILLLTPVIVLGAQWLRTRLRQRPALPARARAGEATLLAAIGAALCLLLFIVERDAGAPLLLYASLPLLLWAALRLRPLFVATLLLALGGSAVFRFRDYDPFAAGAAPESAVALQWFLIALAIPILIVAAAIQERQRAEAAAHGNGERLYLALRAARMSSWSWDPVTRRLAIDAAAPGARAPARVHEDLECFLARVYEDDRDAVRRTLLAAAERGQPYEMEFRLSDAGGAPRWISSRGSPQLDARGRALRVLGVNSDITERKLQAKQIQDQRQELAHLSRVAMLGELSGAITHELNQPLTTVLSNAQAAQHLLEREPVDLAEMRAILADIVAENKRAGEIIRRLRTLLKKGEVLLQPVDVNAVVLEVISLEHSDLIARNVAVSTQFAGDLPAVFADRVQLQQVLLNLMMNAADAMADNSVGERLIRIITRGEQNWVSICVVDRGSGLPQGAAEAIFDPFFSTKAHGLGLGLTICRSIVHAHGGELRASAAGSRGAMFTIRLPVAGVGADEVA